MLTIESIKESGALIFECIVGSRAYGLATENSDTDIKGVYILPKEQFYGFSYIDQVNNDTNDIAYYELKKFMELLSKNNPNILEMLNLPDECILHRHPLFSKIKQEIFLSKLCKDSFAGYAATQIKKARGLNKKIFNPIEKERKSVLDFCYVIENDNSVLVSEWLQNKNYEQENCALSKISHMENMYNLFYNKSSNNNYNGIVNLENSNEVVLSSIPKEERAITQLYFNKTQYSRYCKDYKEYWNWVKNRNEKRYENTISHGKNYDAKNMMHTIRLLCMAEEIFSEKKINVKRANREELLLIKSGKYNFDELIEIANHKLTNIELLAESSDLPEIPNTFHIEKLLIEIREEWYTKKLDI